jgi:peptidoglycan/xylan/chitin deacetylase (PgdA/CDA1 family)
LSETPTFVSIIVPTRNKEKLLSRCFKSLLKQDYTGEYEVIVVDNGSTDRMQGIASSFGVKVVYEANIVTGPIYQNSLLEVRGEIFACADADTIVQKHWLGTLVGYLRRSPGVVSVSSPYAFFDTGKVVQAFFIIINFIFIKLDDAFRFFTRKGGTIWGSDFAVKRETLLKVGGIDTEIKLLGGDYDLSLRLRGKRKVELLGTLFVLTSARHFREQRILCTYSNYVLNYFNLFLYRRPLPEKLENMMGKLGITLLNSIPFVYWFRGPIRRTNHSSLQIAITFDNGPNEQYTSKILIILREDNVKAATFMIGENIERFPETCQRIQNEGHIITNHSYSHPKWLALKRHKRIAQELQLIQEAICKANGMKPALFQSPYEYWTPWLLRIVRSTILKIITWDNMIDEWEDTKEANEIDNDILKRVRQASIIVLHNRRNGRLNYDRTSLVKALPSILSDLKRQGYQFVTVAEMPRIGQ